MKISRRELLYGVSTLAILKPLEAQAAFAIYQTFNSINSISWQQLAVGAGGFLQGHAIASDNSYLVRCDTYGSYLWNSIAAAINGTTGTFQSLVNSNAMPSTITSAMYDLNTIGGGPGVWEIDFCYNNSSILYMVYPVWGNNVTNSTVYKSTNKGQSWTATGFTPIASSNFPPNDDNSKAYNHKLGIDPNNSNNVFLGSQGSGMFVTQNGGTSWTAVSSSALPFGTGAGITGIIINPNNSNQGFAFVQGTGLYKSTNLNLGASATWAATSGGPTSAILCEFDAAAGVYYAVTPNQNNSLSVYNGTSWSSSISVSAGNYIGGIAVDPNTSGHVVISDTNGNLNENFSSGASGSWSGWSGTSGANPPSFTYTGDIPWQSGLNPYTSPTGIFFDRSVARKLYMRSQRDFFTTTLSGNVTTSTVVTWASQGRGIEQLVANHVLVPWNVSPSNICLVGWDTAFFNQSPTTLNQYPTSFPVLNHSAGGSATPIAGWSIDYSAVTANFLVLLADTSPYGVAPVCYASLSTNGGATWSLLPSLPSNLLTSNYPGSGGGNVAVNSSTNFILAPPFVAPSYTTDGGNTWNTISLPGSPSWTGWMENQEFSGSNTTLIAADRVNFGTFYLLFPGNGTYYSVNGGATWLTDQTSNTFQFHANIVMRAAPNAANDVWVCLGQNANPGQFTNGGALLRSTNAAGGSQTFTTISGMLAFNFGFGAGKSGGPGYSVGAYGFFSTPSISNVTLPGSVPSTVNAVVATGLTYLSTGTNVVFLNSQNNYVTGTVSSYNPISGAISINAVNVSGSGTFTSWQLLVLGLWQSDDAGASWFLVGNQFPNSSLDYVKDVSGDPNAYGQWYVGFNGSGWATYP